jgi:N-acetylmuramic acid 6-phosphate etherase
VKPLFLGIEGGGTRTVAILADDDGKLVRRVEAGAANVKLLTDEQLAGLLESIGAAMPQPNCVAIGLAGARAEADLRRIRSAAAKIWPSVPCRATDDLEIALAAAESGPDQTPRVLVLSGTGSCCFGRNRHGKTVKVGGWGHVLGDGGSGFDIGMRALKLATWHYDAPDRGTTLGRTILRHLRLRDANELIEWAQSARKSQVAGLAVKVFESARQGDKSAAYILAEVRNDLARQAVVCGARLARLRERVQFIFAGSNLVQQPRFARQLAIQLRSLRPGSETTVLHREGAWGAVALARELWRRQRKGRGTKPDRQAPASRAKADGLPVVRTEQLQPTEQRNPRAAHLDTMPLSRAVRLMLSEDAKIPGAILAQSKEIEQAVRHIVRAFKGGGRLFYAGAGTSGRLGVLDASECPPTFGTPPEMVQGIIAGGATALSQAVEGAEDDPGAGARALRLRHVSRRDVVVGISASGRAPFVWGALDEAARCGAITILLCFNPFRGSPGHRRPRLVIAPQIGPEVLAGSTRLKAGTATKLILNIFTTLAMARTGRVAGNLMARVRPTNAKLRDRAVRIVQELRGVDAGTALRALTGAAWNIPQACAKLAGLKTA